MEKNIKTTKKDNYNAIIKVLTSLEGDHTDLIDFCEAQIDALDRKAAKAKERAAEKKEAADALCDAILAVLTNELASIPDITNLVDFEDVTEGKVRSRLPKLVSLGLAERGEITIPGGEGVKTRKIAGYKLSDAE